MTSPGVIERYRSRLPLEAGVRAITLHEGETPLVEAPRLADALGLSCRLLLKLEGLNPTGSFKDRGMTVAVSKAAAEGSRAIICASTGNTSASAAAYAARAGLEAYVVIPQGNIASGKLAQAVVHGAKIAAIDGNFDRALTLVSDLAKTESVTIVNSINPYRIHGQKTAAFEICDELGAAPDYHFLPVGNAGNITAYWMGYREYCEAGLIEAKPKMIGVQAAGAAPIVLGRPVPNPETLATAIRIGNPASWQAAVAARDESGGAIDAVTDEEILEAYRTVAATEGIFAEPASAAAVAGLTKMHAANRLAAPSVIVCTLTGHGLKDPSVAMKTCPAPKATPAELNAVRKALDL
ncbi:MAG: threonine synthase [Gemmatimonadetes bacterium]|nr:threonine synthase [Gemmatimonadota bacterium]